MNAMSTETRDSLKATFDAQLESIVEMVTALQAAEEAGDDEARDIADEEIQNDAISVEVRSGWHSPGSTDGSQTPAEYKILVCTGGPAARIVGDLSEHGEPENAVLEVQDWFTPWARFDVTKKQNAALEAYARCFWFGTE